MSPAVMQKFDSGQSSYLDSPLNHHQQRFIVNSQKVCMYEDTIEEFSNLPTGSYWLQYVLMFAM